MYTTIIIFVSSLYISEDISRYRTKSPFSHDIIDA